MAMLWQDIRYASRRLSKSPGLTAVAILSLTFGIGANSAIFSLMDALMMRPLSVRQPESLIELTTVGKDGQQSGMSLPIFQELARRQQVFSGLFAWFGDSVFNVEANGVLSQGNVCMVTGDFYSDLGVSPILGRLFGPHEVNIGSSTPVPVAVISYGFWQRRFGADSGIIGKSVLVEGHPFTIVGVTRKWFAGMDIGAGPDVTIPLTAAPAVTGGDIDLNSRNSFWISATGRLKDGITIERARTQLESVWPVVLSEAAPADYSGERRQRFLSYRLDVSSAANGIDLYLRSHFSQPLYVLMGAVGMILLVACVNLANLMLARTSARSQEMTVRIALGASRWRLVRQVLTESLLLSAAGASLGLVFAWWASRILANFMTQLSITPVFLNLTPDLRILLVTVTVAIITALLFGIAPAWLATRHHAAHVLQNNARIIGWTAGRLGRILIVTQVALSIVLLHGAGLLVRSLEKLRSINPGFQRQTVLLVELFAKPGGYKNLDIGSYYRELIERISGIPVVHSASWSHLRPTGAYELKDSVSLASNGVTIGPELQADYAIVSPGFFETLGMSLTRGRDFGWADDEHGLRIAILSSNLARQLFPSGDPLGQHIRLGTDPKHASLEVVGVVNDARLFDLRKPDALIVYLPFLQESDFVQYGNLEIRTSGNPKGVASAVRLQLDALGREYASRIRTLDEVSEQALLEERATAMLSGFFAALALLLASVGLYGLMTYVVTLQTREIGIRMALGAERRTVIRSVLGSAFSLTLIGAAVGMPCALAVARLITGMLFGLSTSDVTTIGLTLGSLFLVALIAGYMPAQRATRVDPVVALRYE